jgi:hypothetical protein
MSVPKASTPNLNPGDSIVLKESLPDGWWKVEINGVVSRILIGRVKAIKRQKSSEEKEKGLTRSTSKKDASINGSSAAVFSDSITHPRNQAQTTGSIHLPSNPSIQTQTSPRTFADLRNAGFSPREGENSETLPPPLPLPLPPPIGEEGMHEPDVPVMQLPPTSGGREDLSGVRKKTTRREKSNTARPSKVGTPSQVKSDLLQIALDIEASHTDLSLIVRALENEASVKLPEATSEEAQILERLSKEQRFLDKMIDGSYTPLFNADPKLKPGIALAPMRLLAFSELLIPTVNLGSLSSDEKQTLQLLEFNVFPYKQENNEHHLRLLLMAMFYEFDLPRIFQIPDVTLYRFFNVVSRKYRHVPFHNFYHAFNVTQTMYFFLTTCNASKVLGPLEIMALLIAAICHDCDHPGLNNDFQRKAQTRVYHMHKKSVLENHHYLQCMSALAHSESNILANLTQEDEDQIYIYLRDLILATDLAVHGVILKNLTERKKILGKYAKAGSSVGMVDEDRKLIMCSLMKCADLSNEVRENNLSKLWAKLVMEEFLAQSGIERQLQLPVTPFMDAEKIIVTKEQMNFIEKLCLPLYTQLAQVFPEIEKCCLQLEQNRNIWQDRLRLFFSSPEELKKLSNKSIWEREQVKTKGPNSSLSSTLSMQASNSQIPSTRRVSRAPVPTGSVNSPQREQSGQGPVAAPSNATSSSVSISSSLGIGSTSNMISAHMVPSASTPDLGSKKEKEKEKDKKDTATKAKDPSRALSAGPGVPSKTPKK